MYKILGFLITFAVLVSCNQSSENTAIKVPFVEQTPAIDGDFTEAIWEKQSWLAMEAVWLGSEMDATDFKGKYKLAWNDSLLFLAVEIIDDVLKTNPGEALDGYWNYDCLEVFVDANYERANHQFNHKAWAYHISPQLEVIDIGTDSLPHFYNENLQVSFKAIDKNTYHWELAIKNMQATLTNAEEFSREPFNGSIMGFSLAYCDNDYSESRENFIGSVATEGHFKDMGWIDAACFGTIELSK